MKVFFSGSECGGCAVDRARVEWELKKAGCIVYFIDHRARDLLPIQPGRYLSNYALFTFSIQYASRSPLFYFYEAIL